MKSLSNVLKFNNIFFTHEEYIIDKNNSTIEYNHNNYEEKTSDNEPNLDDIYAQADNIIEDAKKISENIIQDAIIRAQKIEKDAYDTGYSDGHAEGYKYGYDEAAKNVNEKLSTELKKIDQVRQDLYQEKAYIFKQCEREMIELSMEIAKKIIDIELEDDGKYIKLIENTIRNIKGRSTIQLRVSTEDFDRTLKYKDYLVSSIDGLEDIEIIDDKYLLKGSCIVDGGIGVIDGSIQTQLKQIEKAFKSILNDIED